MNIKLLVLLICMHCYHMARADGVKDKPSSYQSGADPVYISDEFKFSHPKEWEVNEFGEDGGATIDFPNDKVNSMSVEVAWRADPYSIKDWSKDQKRRFGKNIFFEKTTIIDGKEALLYHIVPAADKPELFSTRGQREIWELVVVCNKWGLSVTHVAKLSAPADDKIKNAQTPPKVFQELVERFKCISLKPSGGGH